jgi:hypothetical protein
MVQPPDVDRQKVRFVKMLRFGNGEFESNIEGVVPPSVHHARDYFLRVVRELAPDVLLDLSKKPFDCYRRTGLHFDATAHQEKLEELNPYDQIREMSRLRHQHQWNSLDWQHHFENEIIIYNEHLSALQKSIFEWSQTWNLDAAWCRQRAYHTLDYWCSSPVSHKSLVWNYEPAWGPIVAFRQGEHPRFVFEYKTLYPRVGMRAELERLITEDFQAQLKAFLDSRERMAKDAGMSPVRKKREEMHFAWLVFFQVNEMSYERILEQYFPKEYATAKRDGCISERTKRIRKAVNEVSRLIRLSLRKDGIAPGRRPAKS